MYLLDGGYVYKMFERTRRTFSIHISYRYAKLCDLIIVTDVRFSLISSGGIERTTNCRLQRKHQSRQETGGT